MAQPQQTVIVKSLHNGELKRFRLDAAQLSAERLSALGVPAHHIAEVVESARRSVLRDLRDTPPLVRPSPVDRALPPWRTPAAGSLCFFPARRPRRFRLTSNH